MGDAGTKTILTAAGLNALCMMQGPRVSRIVGDDHATICPDEFTEQNAHIYRERMEAWGFKLSELDSYISDYCFFTEETFCIETNPDMSLETYISGRTGEIPYLDYPRVRLLSDVSSNIRGSSHTLIGKITLMARHMEYSAKNPISHGIMHLASWIQDLCCSLAYKPEFVYFPRFLVSTGKPILFDHDENFKNFIMVQKDGKLLGNYMDLMWRASERVSGGKTAINSQFNHRSNVYLRVCEYETRLPPEIQDFEVLETVEQRGVTPFIIGRLGHKMISETEIMMKLDEMNFLFDERLPEVANVATLALRRREFSERTLRNFLSLWRRNSILLKFRYHERYYDREKTESFLNSVHPLRVQVPLGIGPTEDELRVRRDLLLERDRDTEILWSWVLSRPDDLSQLPRALIRDDLPILRNNPEITSVNRLLIVSDDLKMVYQLATLRSVSWWDQKETFRCSMQDWVHSDLTAGTHFDPIREVVVDTGSLDGFINNAADEDLEPLQHGISSDMIQKIRPTRSPYVQEVSEYDSLMDILRLQPEAP